MAVAAQETLIRTGERVNPAELKQIYGLPIKFLNFQDLSVARCRFLNENDVNSLIPGINYRVSQHYGVIEATCISEAGCPILAFVKSEQAIDVVETDPETGKTMPKMKRWEIRSIANLSDRPEGVILSTLETQPLQNDLAFWPGYNLRDHERALKSGLKIILISKQGERVVISFPEGDAV